MTLTLDLAAARAKLDGAGHHLALLNREARTSLHKSDPHSIITDLDPDTGWLSIKLRQQPTELRVSVILGELIHNLRSALDYVVTALVEASGETLLRSHQFPIYTDETGFNNAVGTGDPSKGPLAGVTVGFDEIRSVQPFHLGPGADEGALAMIQRLSNSDKHRAIVAFTAVPLSYQFRLAHNGRIIDEWKPPSGPRWNPGGEVEIMRLRFAQPYPTQFDPQADLEVQLSFIDKAFPPQYPDSIIFELKELAGCVNQVAVVLDLIESI